MPAFRSSETVAASATSLAINKPAGVVSGDVLLAIIVVNSGVSVTSVPAGWEQIGIATPTGHQSRIYKKVAGGSEPASYSWTVSSAASHTGAILAYSDAGVVTQGSLGTAGQASPTAPSVTTTAANQILVCLFGEQTQSPSNSQINGAPSGMALRAQSAISDKPCGAFDQTITSAGATGTRTATTSGGAPSADGVSGHSVVLGLPNTAPTAPAVTSPNGGETIDASHTITWTAATDAEQAQGSLQYHIQFTRDNGSSWADVIALTAAGATSHAWNTSGIAASTQCRVRIRAWDGAAFGPFDESNANFTISHNVAPNAPTLTPKSNFDATQSAQFAWTFSDPDAGDSQSAYQLVITRVSDGAIIFDSGKVAGTVSAHTLAANTLANAVNYQWKVRTWDSLDVVGPYSSLGSFSTSAKPSVTITSPAADQAVIGSSQHTVTWTFSDPESAGQSAFQVKVKDNLAVTQYDSGKVLDVDDRAHLIQNLPNNANDWTIELTVWDAADVASSTAIRIFDVSFTPPAPADLTVTPEQLNGRTVLAWTNHNESTKYQAESSTLGTGAAVVADAGAEGGSAVALDAQNEYVERQHTPAATARHRFKARVRDSAQVANDVRLEIIRVSDSAIIASQTFTGAAAYGNLSLAADLTVNVAYRFRVTKATATVNTITVDWLVVEVFTLTTSNDIYRRKTGAGTWERIAKDQALNSTYNDYTAASGQSYDYKVTAKAANATATDPSVVAGTLTLTGVWLHDPASPSSTARFFKQRTEDRDARRRVPVALHSYVGRALPVPEFGDALEERVGAGLLLLTSSGDLAALRALHDRRVILCYRDDRGRKVFGVIRDLPEKDHRLGHGVDLAVEATDFKEAV